MITEHAILQVKEGESADFERSFLQAQTIIASMKGYLGHELHRDVETAGRYLLLVRWETIEDHQIGFRQSAAYREWSRLLHHFYYPFPEVTHFTRIV